MKSYAFWNNKGGTGKTSLAFQSITQFANDDTSRRILVIDVCPQANLSELLLGGLEGGGSGNLLKVQGGLVRSTVGGYFQSRLPRPYEPGTINAADYIVQPSDYNVEIPTNIDLLCGDPMLELQANAMSTLANNQIPGTNTWGSIVKWIKDFCNSVAGSYDFVFLDLNPSFSIYTQIALAATDRLIIPVMADDSSRRALQNAFSLLYGIKLPSEIYAQHMFATRMDASDMSLPKVHLIVKNRITQYMGPASGYAAVLKSIDAEVDELRLSEPDRVTFPSAAAGMAEVRDFQTTGVVAFARGTPFFSLRSGRLSVRDRRVQINETQRTECVSAVRQVVQNIN